MKVRFIVQAAVIGAIYAALTVILSPISFGPIQIRAAEALTVLPALTPAAVPGLFVGCFAANMVGPYGIMDVVCGSLATLLSASLSYVLRKRTFLVPIPPVVINAAVIGSMLHYAYAVPGLFACMGWIALSEAGACFILGLALLRILGKRREIFRLDR